MHTLMNAMTSGVNPGYVHWEACVTSLIELRADVGRSKAQGIVDVQSKLLIDSWSAKLSPEETARKLWVAANSLLS